MLRPNIAGSPGKMKRPPSEAFPERVLGHGDGELDAALAHLRSDVARPVGDVLSPSAASDTLSVRAAAGLRGYGGGSSSARG